MKKVNQKEKLREAIRLLQYKQAMELLILKKQFHIAYESTKPINLLKNTWHEITTSPDLRGDILDNIIGLATGYLSRKILVGTSGNAVKKIVGSLLQFAIANVVSKHTGTIKETGEKILQKVFKHKIEDPEIYMYHEE